MSPGSPEAGRRDQPPGEDELWEAVATRWDLRLHAIKRLAEAEARTRPPEPPAQPWHGTS
jgi:hypothetical protein